MGKGVRYVLCLLLEGQVSNLSSCTPRAKGHSPEQGALLSTQGRRAKPCKMSQAPLP